MTGVDMSDAQARYDRAMLNIRKGLTFNDGAPKWEADASLAHVKMAREGSASPIKRKYTVGKRLKKVR